MLKNSLELALILSITMYCFSCQKQQLTKKDLMNAYTIGWHQGYKQGKWKSHTREEEIFWKKSRWVQDSCLFENSIWAIK